MILRTLSLLRSLQGASDTLQDARARVQLACDYRWLRGEMRHGLIAAEAVRLADGTPAQAVMLAYPATPARLAGGRWPDDAEARERCFVVGAHACRAAGAPAYRTLEGLSQGLVHGAVAVLRDASRLQYLLDREALRLTWRRPERLPEALARRLGEGQAPPGCFLLEVRVPGGHEAASPDGAWLDRRLDRYRRILPPTAR